MLMWNSVRSGESVSLSKGRGKKCLSINHWAPSPNTCLSPFLYLVVSGKSNQPRRKRILTRSSSVWFIKAVFTFRHALTETLNLTCYINIKPVFFNTLNYGFMKTKMFPINIFSACENVKILLEVYNTLIPCCLLLSIFSWFLKFFFYIFYKNL